MKNMWMHFIVWITLSSVSMHMLEIRRQFIWMGVVGTVNIDPHCCGPLAQHKSCLTFVLVVNRHRNTNIPYCSDSFTICLPPRPDGRNRRTHNAPHIFNRSNVHLHFGTCQTCIVWSLMGRVQSVAATKCTYFMLLGNWSASWQYYFQVDNPFLAMDRLLCQWMQMSDQI